MSMRKEDRVCLDLSDLTTCTLLSSSKSILGIWCLFSWLNLLTFLESNASLTV